MAVAVGFRRQVALFDTQRLRADHHLGLATLWQPAGIYVAYRRLYHASFHHPFKLVHFPKEGHHKWVDGSAVKLPRGTRLDDFAIAHQGDAVGHKHRFFRIVSHQ